MRSSTEISKRIPERSMLRSDATRQTEKKWASMLQTAEEQWHTSVYWYDLEIIPILNVHWKPDVPIRFVYIWQVSGIRSSETVFTVPQNVRFVCRGRLCMPRSSVLYIRQLGSIWNLMRLFRIIFKNYFKNCMKSVIICSILFRITYAVYTKSGILQYESAE